MHASDLAMRPGPGLLTLVALLVAGGCATEQPQSPVYVEEYRAGGYEQSLALASVEADRKPPTPDHAEAALVAGLSAHALGRADLAEQYLRPLSTHDDRQIAGRASAALGLIALDAGRFRESVDDLVVAARQLVGNESARASLYAGDALMELDRPAEANLRYSLAAAAVRDDPDLAALIEGRLAGGGYALQLGAFSSEDRARAFADSIRERVAGLDLGVPRIVQATIKDRTLYLVHVGLFEDKLIAQTALSELDEGGFIVLAWRDRTESRRPGVALPR